MGAPIMLRAQCNDISVLFPDKRGTKDFAHEHNTKAPEGAAAGAGAGGVLGGTSTTNLTSAEVTFESAVCRLANRAGSRSVSPW